MLKNFTTQRFQTVDSSRNRDSCTNRGGPGAVTMPPPASSIRPHEVSALVAGHIFVQELVRVAISHGDTVRLKRKS